MTLRSGIYCGWVTHRRTRPRAHTLRYSLFYLLLDLDELPALDRFGPLFRWNRRGLLSFYDSDHGHGQDEGEPARGSFRASLTATLLGAGYAARPYRFEVLCLPRIFGYVFNPITVVYCYDAERLIAMLYEVNNTFGQRVNYLLPVTQDGVRVLRHSCEKAMAVSPFFDVTGRYRFDLTTPAARLALSIRYEDAEGLRLHAAFTGRRLPWTARNLLSLLVRFPFATVKVVAGIHWEALRLWLKGIAIHPRPLSKETKPYVGTFDH